MNFRCMFATDQGGIAAMQSNGGGVPACRGITSPTTRALLDTHVGIHPNGPVYDARFVGKGGTAVRVITTLVPANDPGFMATPYDYSPQVPQEARVDLNQVGGDSLDDIWIAGQGGVLLRWPNSLVSMPPPTFTPSPSGTSEDITELVSFPEGLLLGGSNRLLRYVGPLFKP
jgi:hypothetical protein